MSHPLESSPAETSPQPSAGGVQENATCLACGCLCDDIALTVAGERIVEARRACEKGRAWFLLERDRSEPPLARIEGHPCSVDEALDRAGAILTEARAPLVWGLADSAIEAQGAAAALADRLGAVLDLAHGTIAEPVVRAIQRVGRVSATLGEVKNRADVVLFWGVDPVTTHPRHFERYSVEPAGRFVPGGRSDRTVIVADQQRTATAQQADLFLSVPFDTQFEALWTIRALVKGVAIDAHRVADRGLDLETLHALAERLTHARYGAWFFGPDLGRARGGAMNVEALLALVRDLNQRTARFVALTLGAPGNAAGAEAVLTWQTGAALAVDFTRGVPRYRPGEASAQARLARGEVDAALILGAVSPSPAAREALETIPIIHIGSEATASNSPIAATVALATPTLGIDGAGTVARTDGVMLPLRTALTSNRATEHDLLEALRARIERRT